MRAGYPEVEFRAMTLSILRPLRPALILVFILSGFASAQEVPEPVSGQPGKDVVWVPTPAETVELMLTVANVGPMDFVMDLGSGDGRNIIAAARRGARARGVEFNPDLVRLSQQRAAAAGGSDRAQFVEGDMFKADISQASVLALFLLPSNMLQLRSKFLDMTPGSRIVANTFGIEGWTPDRTEGVPNCTSWCSVMLWIVPAKVAGAWQTSNGELTLKQDYQVISGTLGTTPVAGRLNGDQITFTAGGTEYIGKVAGNRIEGTNWTATRR